MKYIGLTGATGLLGSYLLKDLLSAGRAVAVFVRRNRRETAEQRVESVLQRFEQQFLHHSLPRPVVLESGLNDDHLGLSAENQRWVSQNVDTFLHNAASLEFLHDKQTNEPFRSNIEGTQHVLAFCRQHKIRRFHHVSTAYVCGLRQGTIYENELDKGQTFGNVYEETKFQSEQSVRTAGFLDSVTVFRPAIIVGDSQNGFTPTFHGFYTPLKVLYPLLGGSLVSKEGIVEVIQSLGMNPDDEKNFVPVDWISSVMTHIICSEKLHQNVYHLVPSQRTNIGLMSDILVDALAIPKKHGTNNSAAPAIQFHELIETLTTQMNVYRSYWRNDPVFDFGNTQAAAPHLPCPVLNTDILRTLCRYAVESNFGYRKYFPAAVPAKKTLPSPIAIIGMECRLPGADSVTEFWKNIRQGTASFGPVPESRLNRSLYFDPTIGLPDRTYTDLGALIEYRPVDKNVCPISEETESKYDAAHLNLCETAARACRKAGIDPAHFPIENTGIYIGNTTSGCKGSVCTIAVAVPETLELLNDIPDFCRINCSDDIKNNVIKQLQSGVPARSLDGSPFTSASSAAILIAHMLKTNGPCIVFNSACASSLQALSQAVLALQLGEIDAAVVGGASYFSGDTLVLFSYARSLTKNRSCPFDDEADGLVVGEGAVVLLLKRLDDALRDGNTIHGVIREVGVSSDGKGKSLWAPRKEGQIEAMRRAYQNGGIEPADVGYIEAHATSTSLGDATECEALHEFFGKHLAENNPQDDNLQNKIPLGSSKGNVGHTLEVAGLTGLLKAVLCIEHKTIPPVAGLRTLNKKIDWQNIPFYAPVTETQWETKNGKPRIAAVNSFGIGGLNVHVVVEEYQSGTKNESQNVKVLREPPEPIAVVGFGSVLPGALNRQQFETLLFGQTSAIRRVTEERMNEPLLRRTTFAQSKNVPDYYAGFVDGYQYDWKKNKIPPKQIDNANPLQFMILDSVNEAWESAQLDFSPENRYKTGVVVGTIFGGDFATDLAVMLRLPALQQLLRTEMLRNHVNEKTADAVLADFKKHLFKKKSALIDETGSFTASALASRITKSFDLMGGAVAIDAENGSTAAALACCAAQLQLHRNDMMVCISGQRDLGAGIYTALAQMESLPHHPFCSPFDTEFDGSVPAEGCGALLLKRYSDAKRCNNPVYGVIQGIGVCSGDDKRISQQVSMQRACQQSGVSRIDCLEVTTTSEPYMLIHLIDAFAEFSARHSVIYSLTNRVGHLGAVAGMAALQKSLIALKNQVQPANIGVEHTAPFISRYKKIAVPVEPVEWKQRDEPKTVCINTGSFNVYNIILQDKIN